MIREPTVVTQTELTKVFFHKSFPARVDTLQGSRDVGFKVNYNINLVYKLN